MSAKPRVNLILDCFILTALVLTVLSGLNLEHALRSSLEIEAGSVHMAAHWHSWAAFMFIGLIVIHQIFHWKWITSQLKQLVRGSRRQSQVKEA